MAGDLGATPDAGKDRGTVFGGDPGALLVGQRAVGDEPVEGSCGALDGRELCGVGEQIGGCPRAVGLVGGFGGDGPSPLQLITLLVRWWRRGESNP